MKIFASFSFSFTFYRVIKTTLLFSIDHNSSSNNNNNNNNNNNKSVLC